MNVECNEKRRLNSLSNLFQETTDMHMDVHVRTRTQLTKPRGHPRDKLLTGVLDK